MIKPFNTGFESATALATLVDVLIEMSVMLSAGHVVNSTVNGYKQGDGVSGYDECGPCGQPGGQRGNQSGRRSCYV